MFLLLPAIHLSPRWGLDSWGFGVSIHRPPLWGLQRLVQRGTIGVNGSTRNYFSNKL